MIWLAHADMIDSIPIPADARTPELDAAVRATLAAGARVVEIYNMGPGNAGEKEDGSPVTEADIASHHILVEYLSQTGHAILSEEGAQNTTGDKRSNTIWIVDPLDGTADFLDRTGEFTIMVALVRSGRPVIGVILRPTEDVMFVAQEGMGAYRHTAGSGWAKIAVSEKSEISQCIMVCSRHHLSDAEKLFADGLGVREYAQVGSSLKACMISEGRAEVYVTTTDKIKEWDTAASHVIVTEAGGRMTDVRGRPLRYNEGEDVRHRHGIIITNGLVHDRIVYELVQKGTA